MQAQPTSPPIATTTQWRFTCQKRNGTSYLYFLNLHPDDTGSTAMIKLQAEYRRLKTAAPYTIWDRDGIFWSPVLYIATISEVSSFQLLHLTIERLTVPHNSTTDLEAQRGTRCILVTEKTLDLELTAAFNCPELLSDAENFLVINSRFEISSRAFTLQEQKNRQAILIGRELRWLGICVLAIVGTVVCVGVGVGVGFWTRSVDVGISISSGLATILTCVEAFAFWVYR